MSQNGKLMPNLDQNSTKLLNFTVLQRIDPFVEEILITAAHVTFHELNIDLSQWSRKDVQGSLFVVKRNTQPRFQFIVMNRGNTENLVENLLGDFEYEVQVPYLLYWNAAQEVNGIWFYNACECEEVAALFGRILSAYSKLPAKAKITPSKRPKKSAFQSLKSHKVMVWSVDNLRVTGSSPKHGSYGWSTGSLPSSTRNVNDPPEDPTFVNFFSSAMTIENPSFPTIGGEPYKPSTTTTLPNRPVNVPPMIPSPQVAWTAVSTSASLLNLFDTSESSSNRNQATNLVKPFSFFNLALAPAPVPSSSPLMMAPVPSSLPTAPPLQPSNFNCLRIPCSLA